MIEDAAASEAESSVSSTPSVGQSRPKATDNGQSRQKAPNMGQGRLKAPTKAPLSRAPMSRSSRDLFESPDDAALRRPQISGEWYSKGQRQWDDLGTATKKKYHHIGMIEEVAGEREVVSPACKRCEDKGWDCKKYTAVAQQRRSGGKNQAGFACSRCRKDGYNCSSVAVRKSLAERNKELERENKMLKKRVLELEKQLRSKDEEEDDDNDDDKL
jgi:hypothetical protein